MDELRVSVCGAVDGEVAAHIEGIVNRYNLEVMGSDWRPLNVLLRLPGGEVVGGLLGATEWGWLHVEMLAIEEPYRGNGYGSRLLEAAEQEARARGCELAYLSTFSFQARPFYEKHGYEVFGMLEGAGPHGKYWMRKRLRTASSEGSSGASPLIRRASDADIPAIIALTQRWAEEEPTTTGHYPVNTPEDLRSRIAQYFWVAEQGGETVGFVTGEVTDHHGDAWMYQVISPGEQCLALDQLYVHPNRRGSGLGGRLVERLLTEARANGIHNHVVVAANREWMQTLRFYERHGFRRWHFHMFTGESTQERQRRGPA